MRASEQHVSPLEVTGATIPADGLGFPEGPLVLAPGEVAFVEEYRGCISGYRDGVVTTLAYVGGCPNGLAMGPDRRIYFTQNAGGGGWYRCPDPRKCGIYALDLDGGSVEEITSTASNRALRQPNDLCFGLDGSLYFTDPGDEPFMQAGWICRHDSGRSEIVHDLGPTFPNGIGLDGTGRLLWAETRSNRIMASNEPPSVVATLAADSSPDGFALARDGTIVVATLGSGGVDIVCPGSDSTGLVQRLVWADGVKATNCAFDGDHLWVTDASSTSDFPDRPTGRLWRLEIQPNEMAGESEGLPGCPVEDDGARR